MADMSQDVLKNNLTNPAKGFLWEVMFVNPIGGGDADALDARCQSSSIPGRSVGEITIPYKGTPGVRFPGKLQMSHNWSVTFVESTEDRKTFNALHAWHQAIVNDRTGLGGPDPAIQSDVYLKCLDQEGTTWLTIKLVGCYVSEIGEVSLSYETNTNIVFPVTLSYDRWEKVE